MFQSNSRVVKYTKAFTGSLLIAGLASYSIPAQAKPAQISFQLYPNAQFIPCMAANPNVTPTVNVTVKRGELNDYLTFTLNGFKPGIQFDAFTVQNSPQLANGAANPNFKGFGLAWYQTDLEPGQTSIKTILLDQIFGFDPAVNLPPTNTFHIGFWFNNPQDAAACGFDVTKPTPFNGDHKAGPLAFISRPVLPANLGPLCTDPKPQSVPASCNP